MDSTAEVLRIIYNLIISDSDDLSHGPGLALTPIIFETIGVLDIWCSLFYQHGLPGRGLDVNHFARVCGIIDDPMFAMSRPMSERSIPLVNDSSDLLDSI
jgi:hypothetical protein